MSRHSCRWELCRSIDGGYFIRFVAGNGQKVVSSEVYTRKAAALHAIRLVRAGADAEVRDLSAVKP